MQGKKGAFIVIEGGDGSGKATQQQMLAERLRTARRRFLLVDFPRYGQPSAELVERYLANEFGEATRLDPRLASLPYAIDRLAASKDILQELKKGGLVLANRFSASNMAHQGSKLGNRAERKQFFQWLWRLEHEIMGIPEPDYHFILHLPAEAAHKRIVQRAASSTTRKLDAHELDTSHLKRAEQTYLDLAATFPEHFGLIPCLDGTRERSPGEIHEDIWHKVQEITAYA